MDNKMERFLKEQARLQRLMSQAATSPGSKIVSQMEVISQMSRSASSINSDYFKVISKWSTDVSRLAKAGSINLDDLVPRDFHESLEELIDLVNPAITYTYNSDLPSEITVSEKQSISEKKLTWLDYFQIIFMLITFAYGLYDSHVTTHQFTELMGEIQKQTEISEHTNVLLERNNELLEKDIEVQEQNTDIQEQILHEMQSQNLSEEKKLEIQQAIEVKVEQIVESINNFSDSPIDPND